MRRSLRKPLKKSGRILAAIALVACTAFAQDKVRFDPSRDLEGFEQASVSEHKSLYPLATYLEKSGQEISAEEIAKLRSQWGIERAAVAKRIESILSDPREAHLYELERKLTKHPYFSKISHAVDRSVPECFYLVQLPSVAPPATQDTRRIADFYGPPMRRLQAAFEKEFAAPLRLERRADYPVFAVCILENEDEFHAFGQTTEQMWLLSAAYYESDLRMIVAYGEPNAPDTTPAEQRRLVLAEHARALQHAYFGGKEARPLSLWFNLGFASWFSWREGVLADAKDKAAIETDLLVLLVKAMQTPADRDLLLHPLADLLQVRSTRDILLLAKNRAEATRVKEPEILRALELFYAQAALWMHFLHDSQGGRYREPFRSFFGTSMDGLGGLDAFHLAFRGIDVAGLDRDFTRYLCAEHERAFPKVEIDRAWCEAPFADRQPKPATPSSASAPRPADPSEISAPSDAAPAKISIGPADLDGRHGLALQQAMRGDLEGALGALEALAADAVVPPEDVRVAREIARVKQFILLRDGYLASLIQSRQTFAGKHRNLDFIASVEKVEDGWIYLGENSLGLSKIPLADLPPFDVARQAGRREEQGAAEPWARFWPYILAGEKKWEQLLKDDSEEARELREDAKTVYPEIQRTSDAAAALEKIAAWPEPPSMAEAEKLFTAVKSLVATFGDLRLVQRKTDALRSLVGGVIVKTYTEEDPAKLCHGTWTMLGNGLVNIVYEFSKAEEAQDFLRMPGYLADMRKSQPPTVKKEEDSAWTIVGGEFAGSGAACYRHFLDLAAPIRVQYDVMFRSAPKSAEAPAFVFMVGACDDAKGSYVSCLNFGSLSVIDTTNKVFTTLPMEENAFAKKVYHVELRNDGTEVSTWANGEKKFEAPAAGRRNGAVILWFHVDHVIAIQRLEIEGRIDPTWPEKARSQFYRNKLADIGFR